MHPRRQGVAARHYGIDIRESARAENFPKWLHLLVAHSDDNGGGSGGDGEGGGDGGGGGGGGKAGEGGVLKTQGPKVSALSCGEYTVSPPTW